jgi:hypothetical protein
MSTGTAQESAGASTQTRTGGRGETTPPPEERRRMIATAAYMRAERRRFVCGDPVADWLAQVPGQRAPKDLARNPGQPTFRAG